MRAFFGLVDRITDLLTFPEPNDAYPQTPDEIDSEYARLSSTPAPIARPIVIIAGYHAPAVQTHALRARLMTLTGAPASAFACLSYQHHIMTDRVVDSLCTQLERDYALLIDKDPCTAHQTIEVDAVGISAGGLFSRALSLPRFGTQRRTLTLRPRRIFTLGTPHRGAILARDIQLDPMGLDLREGSAFLRHLDATPSPTRYELVCYARLRDAWVGATNASPPGQHPIWTPGLIACSHLSLTQDRRILVDLARRLRGESPWASASVPPCD